jgi:hypothetical protein
VEACGNRSGVSKRVVGAFCASKGLGQYGAFDDFGSTSEYYLNVIVVLSWSEDHFAEAARRD